MLVPVRELPPLIIAPPGCEPTPLPEIMPGQYPIFTSPTNPFHFCIHANRGVNVSDIVPVDDLPWFETLLVLTDEWRKPPPAYFMSTPRFFPHRHANSIYSDDEEDSSSEFSVSEDDGAGYTQFELWAAECAGPSSCTDALPSPMDEDIDETSFIRIVQRPPAWYSDSVKGSHWVRHLRPVTTV